MQLLFLTDDTNKKLFYSSGDWKLQKNFARCASLANWEVIISSWNNLIVKNNRVYVKRGVLVNKNSTQQIDSYKEVNPFYINFRFALNYHHVDVHHNNFEVLHFLLSRDVIESYFLNNCQITEQYIDYLKTHFWPNAYTSMDYLGDYIEKWPLEHSFRYAEENQISIPRPFTFAQSKVEMLEFLKNNFLDKKQNKYFIVKPNGGTCSQGIYLLSKKNFRTQIEKIKNDPNDFFVVQEYISDILFYNKFFSDLRIHVGIFSWDPLVFKVYKSGFIRLGYEKFDLRKFSNPYVSLAWQPQTEVFFGDYFSAFNICTDDIWEKIENVTRNALTAVALRLKKERKIQEQYASLYGIDFLIKKEKKDANPLILEINRFPTFYIGSQKISAKQYNNFLDQGYVDYFTDLKFFLENQL